MLKTLAKLGLAALAVATISGGAFAADEIKVYSASNEAAPFTDSINLLKFDPSLGTLTNVTMRLTTSNVSEIDVFDFSYTGPHPATGSYSGVTSAVNLTVIGPPSNVAIPALDTTVSSTIGAGTISQLFLPFTGISSSNDTGWQTVTSPWTQYVGVGYTSSLVKVESSGANVQGTGLVGTSVSGSAVVSYSLSVDYTYTPAVGGHTPEPGSVALLLAGGTTAFAGLRRRRSLKK